MHTEESFVYCTSTHVLHVQVAELRASDCDQAGTANARVEFAPAAHSDDVWRFFELRPSGALALPMCIAFACARSAALFALCFSLSRTVTLKHETRVTSHVNLSWSFKVGFPCVFQRKVLQLLLERKTFQNHLLVFLSVTASSHSLTIRIIF